MVALSAAHTEPVVEAVSFESIDEVLRQLGPGPTRQAIVEIVRHAVLRDIDMNVNRKNEDMGKKGRVLLQEMDQKRKQMEARFSEVLAKVQEKQLALEAENALLRQTLIDLNHRFSKLGGVLASDPVTSCSNTPSHSQKLPEQSSCGEMPVVRAFPYPTPVALDTDAATPLSLASALGVPTQATEALVRQKRPLSLMEILAPPTSSALPLIPSHPSADSSRVCFSNGIEAASSQSPLFWGQAQVEQVERTEEEPDGQNLLELAMLYDGCPSLCARSDNSLNARGLSCFAMRAGASVFVPSVSLGGA